MSEVINTQFAEFFAALAAPFQPGEVKHRSQAGREFDYVTARTVMNRLDDVCGPEGWWDDFVPLEHAVICRLTIKLPDGTTLTKSDAGGYAGMSDPGDDDKSGFADSIKRAAVKFGVGRYLYKDGVPNFARSMFANGGGQPQPRAQQPSQPSAPSRAPQQDRRPTGTDSSSNGRRTFDDTQMPRDGRGLFAWAMKRAEEQGLKKYAVIDDVAAIVEELGLGYDTKAMTKWTSEQVAAVWPTLVGTANAPQKEPELQPVAGKRGSYAEPGFAPIPDKEEDDIPF